MAKSSPALHFFNATIIKKAPPQCQFYDDFNIKYKWCIIIFLQRIFVQNYLTKNDFEGEVKIDFEHKQERINVINIFSQRLPAGQDY